MIEVKVVELFGHRGPTLEQDLAALLGAGFEIVSFDLASRVGVFTRTVDDEPADKGGTSE
jgi:hypothetical protein